MPDNLSNDQLREQLLILNEHFAPLFFEFRDRWGGDASRQPEIGEYINRLGLGEDNPVNPDRGKFFDKGAAAFFEILSEHPTFRGEEPSQVGLPVLGDFDPSDNSINLMRRDAGDLLAAGLIAISHIGGLDERAISSLLQIAFSADRLSQALGRVLLGKPLPPDFDPPIPEKLMDLKKEMDRLMENVCGWAIEGAAHEFSAALAGELRAAQELEENPLQYMAYTTGIASLTPDRGCEGQPVIIGGLGFVSAQPENVSVYFPRYGGGCVEATVVQAGWSDQTIQVTVPVQVGVGCVGFIKKMGNWQPAEPGRLTGAASNLAGTMEMCLGPMGFKGAQSIRNAGEFRSPSPHLPCPDCLPNDENLFWGGPPFIKSFTVDGKMVVNLIPGVQAQVAWEVENASQVSIIPLSIGGQEHELRLLSQVPEIGSHQFTPAGSFAWNAEYELRAENSCGVVSRKIVVKLRPQPEPAPKINDFLWGVSTAATQVEGKLTLNDWDVFTNSPKIVKRVADNAANSPVRASIQIKPPGEADGHRDLDVFRQDLVRAKVLGINAYRFSIEWSRIQPNPPDWASKSIAARQNAAQALQLAVFYDSIKDYSNAAVARAQAGQFLADAETVEKAAIGPADSNFDIIAIAFYKSMVQAIRNAGMIPVLTLNHLSLPKWVLTPPEDSVFLPSLPWAALFSASDSDPKFNASLRGWEDQRIVKAFNAFVTRVVPEFPDVTYWITLNEPVGSIMGAGYIGGVWPPGFVGDQKKAKAVMENMITAHVRAFDTIKSLRPGARVGFAHAMISFKKTNGSDPLGAHLGATAQLNYIFNEYFLNAVVHGDIDDNFHRNNRNNRRVDGIAPSNWQPKLDFIGVNYYRSAYVFRDDLFAAKTGLVWGGAYWNDLHTHHADEPNHNLLNDLGWEVHPEGLYAILKNLHTNYRQLPILITENGMPEDQDRNRAAYTISHLDQLFRARADGVNILGYIHWSLIDNWEWHEGYRPEARFGLYTIPGLNGSNGSLPRAITEGAVAMQYLISESPNLQPALHRFGTISALGNSTTPPTMSAGAIWQGGLDLGYGFRIPLTVYLSSTTSNKLLGMIYYPNENRWVRLVGLAWDNNTQLLHFSHGKVADTIPPRLFEAAIANQSLNGTVVEEGAILDKFTFSTWSANRNPLHGVWNKQSGGFSGFDIVSLMLNMFENHVLGKCILKLGPKTWWAFDTISINPNGTFKLEITNQRAWLTFGALHINGQISGNTLTASADLDIYGGPTVNFSWVGALALTGLPF